MKELIARLEKATEGSRELDDAIAGAVLEYAGSVRLVGMPDSEASIKTFRRHAEGAGSSLRYTTSLDAALTLVPEGWFFSLAHAAPDFLNAGEPAFNAEMHGPVSWVVPEPPGYEEPAFDSTAARALTPALALCIAALKARSEA